VTSNIQVLTLAV